MVCVGLLLLTAVVLLPVDRLRDGPAWSPQAVADAYLAALAEGRPDRLCDAFADPDGCSTRAVAAVEALCEDAREAYAAVPARVAGEGDGRQVEVDFRPEQRPSCPTTDFDAVRDFELQRRDSRWVVVCPVRPQAGPAGC